eukprot:scaffold103037_cov84-Phaeocystis_antarctica.AAC.1
MRKRQEASSNGHLPDCELLPGTLGPELAAELADELIMLQLQLRRAEQTARRAGVAAWWQVAPK